MADVTCIGLGLMGSELARAFPKDGHGVAVWNRTPGKADDIAQAGATVAKSLAEAIAESPVVVVCLADYQSTRPLLKALGENTPLAGSDPGAAAAVDFAWLINRYGIYLSAAHGCLLCEAEGVGLEHSAEVFAPNDPARWVIDVVRTNSFANPTATLSVWKAALAHIAEQIEERGLDNSFAGLVQGVLTRAEEEGFGEEHIAAMVMVLGRPRS